MSAKNTSEGLKRVIGIPALAATIVNNTIGAGIYVLPAVVGLQMGAAGIVEYLFCAIMLVSIMLCYVEIGSRITTSGGSYVYVETVFGPLAGFIVNWLFFIGWGSIGSAAVMNVLGDSLAVLFPVFSNPWLRALLFFCLLGLMVLVNIRGAKGAVRFVEYITIVKLVPLFGIIIFGFSQVKAVNLHWEHFPALKTFGETALVAFFAFAGFETALNNSGEIENPRRTIPRGILLGGTLVFIIYILLQLVTQGVLGAQMATYKDAPLAAIAEKIVGPMGAILLLIAAIFSCLGLAAGDVLATPRLLFAGANDGLLPKFLGKVHPRFATPYVAVITYAALIFIFSVSGGFKSLAVLASGSLLLIYLAVILAMIKLRMKKHTGAEKMFRIPGGLIIPVFSIVAIVWMLSQLTGKEMFWTLIFIIGVCVIYFAMRFFKKAA
jgi:APA family basic amino acid/polyamine antiporter